MRFLLSTLIIISSIAIVRGQDSLAFTARSLNTYCVIDKLDNWSLNQLTVGVKKGNEFVLLWDNGLYRRFNTNDFSSGLDMYWKFLPSMYVHSTFKIARSRFLPKQHMHLELYQLLGKTEFSAGFRRLNFDKPVNMGTASFGYYWANNWTSARGYYNRLIGTEEDNINLNFIHRYYLGSNSYVGVNLGWGENYTASTENRVLTKINRKTAGMTAQKAIGNYAFKLLFNYSHERLAYGDRNRFEVGLEIQYK